MKRAWQIAAEMKVDWLIYLDADEFIILNAYRGVKEMLDRHHFADSLALNWVVFGTNHHVQEPSGLILENYTKSSMHFDRHIKTFVRPSQVSTVCATNPHFYHIVRPNRMFAVTGECLNNQSIVNPTKKDIRKATAFIAHYSFQSEESYLSRKLLLPTDDIGDFRKKELNIHARNNDVENRMPLKYVSDVVRFMESRGTGK
jgi:hypothetical protein